MELQSKEERHFNAEALEHMRNLRLLFFNYGPFYWGNKGENHVKGDLRFLSHKLSVLVWHRYPLKCLPSTFDPKIFFQLDMPGSRIEHLWERDKVRTYLQESLTFIYYLHVNQMSHIVYLTGCAGIYVCYAACEQLDKHQFNALSIS